LGLSSAAVAAIAINSHSRSNGRQQRRENEKGRFWPLSSKQPRTESFGKALGDSLVISMHFSRRFFNQETFRTQFVCFFNCDSPTSFGLIFVLGTYICFSLGRLEGVLSNKWGRSFGTNTSQEIRRFRTEEIRATKIQSLRQDRFLHKN
jgi:hypothetical protein